MTTEDRRMKLARAGQWLREQRQRRGFATAAEFARAAGIDKGLVSNYEVGRTSVPDDRAEQIAEALGMGLIEVRRNLGLWVPPEEDAEDTRTNEEIIRDIDARYDEIERQLDADLAWARREAREDLVLALELIKRHRRPA
jgi:transcriptional regulator with XRE-family HTH domain